MAETTLTEGPVEVKVTVTDSTPVDEDLPKEKDVVSPESVDQAIKLANDQRSINTVPGYGRSDDGYGGPYHPDAFLNHAVEFALAGAPEAQAKYQEDLIKYEKAIHKDGDFDKVDLVAGSAHTTVVETQPFRAAHATPELDATEDNVAEAAARKHLIVPKSNEGAKDVNQRAFDQVEPKAPKESETKNDAKPATPGAEAQGVPAAETRNDPGEPGKSEQTVKKQTSSSKPAAKKTAAKKTTAKKTTSRKNVKVS